MNCHHHCCLHRPHQCTPHCSQLLLSPHLREGVISLIGLHTEVLHLLRKKTPSLLTMLTWLKTMDVCILTSISGCCYWTWRKWLLHHITWYCLPGCFNPLAQQGSWWCFEIPTFCVLMLSGICQPRVIEGSHVCFETGIPYNISSLYEFWTASWYNGCMESQFIGFCLGCKTCVALVSVSNKEAFGEWEGANGVWR